MFTLLPFVTAPPLSLFPFLLSTFPFPRSPLLLMERFEHNISIETHVLDILLLIWTCSSRLTPPVHVCVGRELQVAVDDHDFCRHQGSKFPWSWFCHGCIASFCLFPLDGAPIKLLPFIKVMEAGEIAFSVMHDALCIVWKFAFVVRNHAWVFC